LENETRVGEHEIRNLRWCDLRDAEKRRGHLDIRALILRIRSFTYERPLIRTLLTKFTQTFLMKWGLIKFRFRIEAEILTIRFGFWLSRLSFISLEWKVIEYFICTLGGDGLELRGVGPECLRLMVVLHRADLSNSIQSNSTKNCAGPH
jgi:hypothetical protein